MGQTLLYLIKRLDAVLAEEAQILASGGAGDIERLVDRKSKIADELFRVSTFSEGIAVGIAIRTQITSMKRALEQNQRLLKLHRDVLDDILGRLTGTLDAAGDAGLYTRPIFTKRLGP
jgi:hypothetical protein